MIEDIQKLLDDYSAWLKDKATLREVRDCVEITTPYLDRHNDYIQIYAKRVNGGFLLTDDGHTIGDLDQSGCNLQTPRRQELLEMILNGFGVQLHGDAIEIHASKDNFVMRTHNVVQSILAVNDLFFPAAPGGASLFFQPEKPEHRAETSAPSGQMWIRQLVDPPAPADVAAYLRQQHCTPAGTRVGWADYKKDVGGQDVVLEVPQLAAAIDYPRAVGFLVDDLARLEGRSPTSLLRDIKAATGDAVLGARALLKKPAFPPNRLIKEGRRPRPLSTQKLPCPD